ncbi:PIN domain containing protein [Halorhabdus sp. BNX81]|nr:PIN domain containing protein [Halorhabdus sp. BNX81]
MVEIHSVRQCAENRPLLRAQIADVHVLPEGIDIEVRIGDDQLGSRRACRRSDHHIPGGQLYPVCHQLLLQSHRLYRDSLGELYGLHAAEVLASLVDIGRAGRVDLADEDFEDADTRGEKRILIVNERDYVVDIAQVVDDDGRIEKTHR